MGNLRILPVPPVPAVAEPQNHFTVFPENFAAALAFRRAGWYITSLTNSGLDMLTELFLAGRYLKPKRNAVSLITLSSVLGVTLGVAVLMVVLAVMTGFTDLMKQKLVETQAHFQVRDPWRRVIRDPSAIVETVRSAGGDAAAVIQSPVLVQRGRELDMQLLLFGTGAEELRKHLQFDTALRRGMLSLEKNEAIISTHMAARWGVKVGDKILLHSPKRLTSLVRFKPDGGMEINPDSSAYLPSEFTVTGIYSIGKYDFDRSVLFVGIDDAAELLDLPWGSATSVFGWGPDPFEQKELIKTLREKLGSYRVSTWEDENKQLLSVLAVEKRMMFFLLIFIVLVAAFSITNTLVTSVYQKTREIGLLKALGAGDGAVTRIFVLQGFLIGVIGSGVGTLLGWLVIHFRNDIMHFVSRVTGTELFPKELYYFDELPAHIVPGDVGFIIAASVILCTLGALLPALRAALLDPAKALRYE